MRPELVALYGGPDQVMGLASGIAAAVGVLMMFWNKVLITVGKIVDKFHPSGASQDSGPSDQAT